LYKVRLPNNRIATREKVSHPGAVGVVPISKEGKVVLVRQFRYPPERNLLEIPAGKLDKNETPKRCAKRELSEEVGARGGRLIHLVTFYTSPGFSDEILYLFMAIGFEREENHPDEDEFLYVLEFGLDDAVSFIKEGKIKDAKTIIGILLARDYLNGNYKVGSKNKE